MAIAAGVAAEKVKVVPAVERTCTSRCARGHRPKPAQTSDTRSFISMDRSPQRAQDEVEHVAVAPSSRAASTSITLASCESKTKATHQGRSVLPGLAALRASKVPASIARSPDRSHGAPRRICDAGDCLHTREWGRESPSDLRAPGRTPPRPTSARQQSREEPGEADRRAAHLEEHCPRDGRLQSRPSRGREGRAGRAPREGDESAAGAGAVADRARGDPCTRRGGRHSGAVRDRGGWACAHANVHARQGQAAVRAAACVRTRTPADCPGVRDRAATTGVAPVTRPFALAPGDASARSGS
jgi:hypothetical protein